jgi:hypothetical protein
MKQEALMTIMQRYSREMGELIGNDDTKLQLVAIKMIENSKDTADGTSRSVEKKPTSNAKLTKPFIQVGIFGVENNAVKTGNQMSKLGLQTNTFEFNEFC